MALLFTVRPRFWTPVVLSCIAATILANVIATDRSLLLTGVFGCAAVMEAAVGALLLRWYLGPKIEFSRLIHVVTFVLFAAVISTALCALVGAAGVSSAYPSSSYWPAFQVWWFSDALGVLLTAPAVLAWTAVVKDRVNPFPRKQKLEAVLLFGLLILTVQLIFGADPGPIRFVFDHPYIIFPLLLWVAIRFEAPIVTTALFVIAVLVVEHTGRGKGPFVGNSRSVEELVLSVQAFLTFAALSTLGLLAITGERTRIVQALQASEKASREKEVHLDDLLANVDAIILEGDPFDIYYVGGQVEKILGYPKEMWFEHSGGPVGFWSGLLHPDDTDSVETCRKAIERGEDHAFEYRLIAKNGKSVWFYDSVMVETRDGKPVKTRSVMIDITERKQTEEEACKHRDELAHVARVSTMGEMATGIAHELNQPLTAISLYSDAARILASRFDSDSHEIREILSKLEDQVIRAGDIVRRLRDYVKKTSSVRVAADLNALVQDVAKFVEPDIRKADAMLVVETQKPSPSVLVDQIQIQQVLVNLIRNAVDAMQETPTEQRRVIVSTRILQDGQSEVVVRDAGKGLARNELDQAFNAFFTTKQEGLGMGLPISRSIVEAHGGRLWVEPNAGPGVTFGFTIPLEGNHGQ